tara:strand:+ start:115 stop:228 length:114 start_codon:yes stop_codon:yes gene_type:complete
MERDVLARRLEILMGKYLDSNWDESKVKRRGIDLDSD